MPIIKGKYVSADSIQWDSPVVGIRKLQLQAMEDGTWKPGMFSNYEKKGSGTYGPKDEPKPVEPKPSAPETPAPQPQQPAPTQPQQPAPTPPQPQTPSPQPQPQQPAPQQPAPQKPSVPSYTPTAYKPPSYTQLSYDDARKQAAGQLDPIYQQALEEIQRQRFSNEQKAGNIAASRGLGRSGLAADLQNKVNIAAQQQSTGLAAQRASQEAQLAQSLIDKDLARQQELRDFALREYLAQNQIGLGSAEFEWRKHMGQSDLDFRDKQFDWQKQQGASDLDFRNRQFEWQKQQSDADRAFREQQLKQQQEQYNRDYILRQLAAMAQAGIDISKLQEQWLLRPWG